MENWFVGPKLIVGALTDQVPIGFIGVGRTGAKPNALLTFPVVKKKLREIFSYRFNKVNELFVPSGPTR